MKKSTTLMKPMKRGDITDLIAFRKITLGIKWAAVAKKVGQSKEWTTAACLGQMQMTQKQAETVGKIFDLPEEAVLILQTVPYKGSMPTAVPTDPLIYRWYERRPGACRTVGQVPALQDVLNPDAAWPRRFNSARMGGQPSGHCSSRGDCMPQMLFSYHSFPEAL